MSFLRFFCAIIASVFLFGCFQTETVIRLKPDGSGVVEETFLLSKVFLESFQEMMKGLDETGKGKQDPIQGMIRDAQSKENQYGPEVKFVSAVPLTTETMGGYKAVYAFKDINKLKINQNPGKKTDIPGSKDSLPTKEENILFHLTKGPVSSLTVTMPRGKDKEDKEATASKKDKTDQEQPDPKALEQMRRVLEDMGIRIAIEIEGTILKTNATYRKKSTLTLVEMHFGKLLENKDLFEKVVASQPKTVEEAKELVKGIEGLKIEMANPVVVEFK